MAKKQSITPLPGMCYSWNPMDPKGRRFVLHYGHGQVLCEKVHPRAVAIRIRLLNDAVVPDVSPLVPPQHPLSRLVWDCGFLKRYQKRTVQRAIDAYEKIDVSIRSQCRKVIDEKCAFFFIPPPFSGAELQAVLWSVEHGVRAEEIEPLLRKHCAFR